MKRIIGMIFLMVWVNNSFAQTDLKVIDNMVGKNGALRELKPKSLNPNSRFCFDKRFWFTTNISGKVTKGCFYVNTRDGYVGINNTKDGSCEVQINDKKLMFMVISKMGQNFVYTNGPRDERWYMSMPSRSVEPSGKFIKRHGRNEGERRRFTEQSLSTWAYYDPAEGETETAMYKYMYGNGYPVDGNVKNYLGANGIGFFLIGEETFLCLSQEKGDKYTTVDRFEEVNFCFDGSEFKDRIGTAVREDNKINEEANKQIEASQRSISNSNSYCKDFEQKLLDHKALMLKLREKADQLLEAHANMNDPANQKTMADAQDPINDVIRQRLEFLKDQCDARYTRDKIATTEAQKKRANDKIVCLQERINALNELEDKLNKIGEESVNNVAQAQLKKSMFYLTNVGKVLKITCN